MLEVFKESPAPWRVVPAKGEVFACGYWVSAEDDCIVDANGAEVLGTSEWLRCDPKTLQFIVDCVNREAANA